MIKMELVILNIIFLNYKKLERKENNEISYYHRLYTKLYFTFLYIPFYLFLSLYLRNFIKNLSIYFSKNLFKKEKIILFVNLKSYNNSN